MQSKFNNNKYDYIGFIFLLLIVEKIGLCPFLKNNPAFCPISQTN